MHIERGAAHQRRIVGAQRHQSTVGGDTRAGRRHRQALAQRPLDDLPAHLGCARQSDIVGYQDRIGAAGPDGGERLRQLGRVACADSVQRDAQLRGCGTQVIQVAAITRVVRVTQHRHACDARRQLLEQLQALLVLPDTHQRQAGHIADGPREVAGQPLHRCLPGRPDDDRDRRRGCRSSIRADGGVGVDDIRAQRHQFGRQRRQPFGGAFRKPGFECHVASVAVAQGTQPFEQATGATALVVGQAGHVRLFGRRQDGDFREPDGLLRPRGQCDARRNQSQ